ncbi:MAG: DUF4340 domain-containing protein [Chloroflexota bacterium]
MMRRTTWIVLGVFVVLLAAMLFWQRTKQANAPEPTPVAATEGEFLLNLGNAAVARLTVQNAEGATVVLERSEEGTWRIMQPEVAAADGAAVDAGITQLLALRILSTPSSVPSLDVVGLDAPAYRILIDLDDGKQVAVNIGKATPTGSGYYVLAPDRIVHIVGKYGVDAITKLADVPPLAPTATPEVIPTP